MKLFWPIVLVLAVLAAVFLVAFNPFKPVGTPLPQTTDENTDFLVTENLLPSPPSPGSVDLSNCQALAGSEKTDCIWNVAEQKKDSSVCGLLSSDDAPWCQKDVMVAQGNEDACDSLQQPQKNQCHYDFGYRANSLASCQKILPLSSSMANDCLRFVSQHTKKTDGCSLVSDPDIKDDCIFTVAVESNSVGLCSTIKDNDVRKDCELSFQPVPDLQPDEP